MKKRKLQASFSVEASYVFWIVFLAIAFVIRVAWDERNKALAGYVISEANEAAAHTEELFAAGGRDTEDISACAGNRTAGIPQLSSGGISIERNLFRSTSSLRAGPIDRSVQQRINNPEGWMRLTTVFEEMKERLGKDGKSESGSE